MDLRSSQYYFWFYYVRDTTQKQENYMNMYYFFICFSFKRNLIQKQSHNDVYCDIFLSLSLNTIFLSGNAVWGWPTKSPFRAHPSTSPPTPLCKLYRMWQEALKYSFYKADTLCCFTRPPPLHTLSHLCPIHWRRLTGHLYAFCHTLEEFSICSVCDFGAVSLQEKKWMKRFSPSSCSFSH